MRRDPDHEAEELMFSLRLQIPIIFHQPLKEMAAKVDRPMVAVARIILVDGIRRWIARAPCARFLWPPKRFFRFAHGPPP
jgi:hypothetical protein